MQDFVADKNGWIQWTGGKCPVPLLSLVHIGVRAGYTVECEANKAQWQHSGQAGDVVCYRIPAAHRHPADSLKGASDLFKGVADKMAAALGVMSSAGQEWMQEQVVRNESISDELTSAPALLARAKQHMDDRAATYDKPGGERSMGATVAMFNIATGRDGISLGVAKNHARALLASATVMGNNINMAAVMENLEAFVVLLDEVPAPSVSESEGWLMMSLLKIVRDRQRQQPHVDSIEDNIAYSALYGEARLREG